MFFAEAVGNLRLALDRVLVLSINLAGVFAAGFTLIELSQSRQNFIVDAIGLDDLLVDRRYLFRSFRGGFEIGDIEPAFAGFRLVGRGGDVLQAKALAIY